MNKGGMGSVDINTGTKSQFTYVTLGDSRDSVNNLIHGRVGSSHGLRRAAGVTRPYL
jgi:hypothetical protein